MTHDYEAIRAEVLQTLRENTARDLETWREVLALYEERGDSHGVGMASRQILDARLLLADLNALLVQVEESHA